MGATLAVRPQGGGGVALRTAGQQPELRYRIGDDMRWVAVIVAGWVVLTFLVGVLVGHMITRRPQEQGTLRTSARGESAPDQSRTKRPA